MDTLAGRPVTWSLMGRGLTRVRSSQAHVIISFEFFGKPNQAHPQVISFSVSQVILEWIPFSLSVAHCPSCSTSVSSSSAGHMMVQVLAHRRVSLGRARVEVPSPRSTAMEQSGTEFTPRLLGFNNSEDVAHSQRLMHECTVTPPPSSSTRKHTHTHTHTHVLCRVARHENESLALCLSYAHTSRAHRPLHPHSCATASSGTVSTLSSQVSTLTSQLTSANSQVSALTTQL